MTNPAKAAPVAIERIERANLVVRGHKFVLDSDLAALYEVETRALVRAVKPTRPFSARLHVPAHGRRHKR